MFFAEAQEMVTQFHERIGAPVASSPRLLPCNQQKAKHFAKQLEALSKAVADEANGTTDVLLSRTAMALEELAEWLAAHSDGDLHGAADAVADRAYVLVGDAVAAGMPLADLFVEIHHSNMTKLPGITNGNGKAIASVGPGRNQSQLAKGSYQPPKVADVLEINVETCTSTKSISR